MCPEVLGKLCFLLPNICKIKTMETSSEVCRLYTEIFTTHKRDLINLQVQHNFP